jgi:hypothetical protein
VLQGEKNLAAPRPETGLTSVAARATRRDSENRGGESLP